MTTRDFIRKTYNTKATKDRSCSSVFTNMNGVVYSYGYHYPLAFNVGGLDFVNNTGYSNSTAKHIGWAHQALDYTGIKVWVQGCGQYDWNNPENYSRVPYMLYNRHRFTDEQILDAILKDLETERKDISKRIASKTRTDTQIYESLQRELKDCSLRISSVTEVWSEL